MEKPSVVQALATISSRAGRYAAYLSALAGLRGNDILLASFPRSGNTWIRFFLCNLISLREWNSRAVDFAVVNDTMPALGLNNLLRPWPHSTIPRVIKTHQRYSPLLGGVRSIGIVRDPRDVMVSLFHYRRDRKATYEGSFSQFIHHPRYGLEAWFKHYTSWQGRWTILVKYEDMRENQAREFSRICDMIEVNLPKELVDEAIARSNIGSARRTEKAFGVEGQALFARSGASGQWKPYFSERDVALYRELVARFDARVYP
jgi:estrone sulfotransferase